MPIFFNEETNRFEGENSFGETLQGFDFSIFGGLVSNSGMILGPITANDSEGIIFSNTRDGFLSKAAGSQYAVDLKGNSGHSFFNDGTIFGSVRLANGWDTFNNSGSITGQIDLGKGNDQLINQIIPGIDGGPLTVGTITGTVSMGSGDDTVLNAGILSNVLLGDGNDSYLVGGFEGPVNAYATSGDVRGESGMDTITGGTSDERFYGGSDADLLKGNGGKDKLYGESGNDAIFGGNGNDYIDGGAGRDTLDGGNNNDRIFGGTGEDVIHAGGGNDLVQGGDDADVIFGDKGNDKLYGGNGNDIIEGGEGRDLLSGGSGADTFVFGHKTNRDTIVDFSDGDRIELLVPFGTELTYADVMASTTFSGGDAIINLSTLMPTSNFDQANKGSVLTIENVTLADLDEAAFELTQDYIAVG